MTIIWEPKTTSLATVATSILSGWFGSTVWTNSKTTSSCGENVLKIPSNIFPFDNWICKMVRDENKGE